MHISVPIANTMEYIQNTEVSPLISKGICKVCYVGQEPNRKNTVITKDLAREMGRKLPGSPIVGYFDQETEDFDTHSREIVVKNGKFELIDITRPYGFVPTDANVWFEKFDDEGVEHEYLVTDAYIWTGAYPESQRIMSQGNNQSMELTKEQGFWANDNKTNARIFIYNEALIEKLCILGENVEPCFEGAQIANHFSLEDDPAFQEFKTTMFSMLDELRKGGSQVSMDTETIISVDLAPQGQFEKKKPEEEEKENKKPAPGEEKDDKDSQNQGASKKPDDDDKDDDKKKKYNLEDVVEYADLMTKYTELNNNYSALQKEVADLRQFKLEAERDSKTAMINKFFMLSDDDKKDVVDNIDTYSLDEIEAKLSVIAVRNKVNFSLDYSEEEATKEEDSPQGLFNLNSAVEGGNDAPAWIKAIRETAKKQ